jgi:anthranilate synthase component 1
LKIKPAFSEFAQLAHTGNLIPVYQEFLADTETPVSAFLKLRDDAYSYLLESADGGKRWGRHSFIGCTPYLRVVSRDCQMEIHEDNEKRVLKADFEDAVRRVKDYIVAGEAIQVVLSQQFSGAVSGEDFTLYRNLRSVNPSPYMFYLNFGDMKLIGASPEILVRLTDGKIELRPNAGTRPRGATPEEDRALEKELVADPKERAGHIMLVDLGRNDVGKVAAPGSVKVPRLMEIERYSHVMHIVSRVEGILKPGADGFDLFMSAFPAGTVSGAPKIRAMEIISELEPGPRGPYAGAVGYFGFNGNTDFCITIRTITICKDRLSVQVGAGIVADSSPENEYEETLKKAGAMFKAIEKVKVNDSAD